MSLFGKKDKHRFFITTASRVVKKVVSETQFAKEILEQLVVDDLCVDCGEVRTTTTAYFTSATYWEEKVVRADDIRDDRTDPPRRDV